MEGLQRVNPPIEIIVYSIIGSGIMSINSYLDSLASDLVLSSSEDDKIEGSVSTLKTRLTLYFGSEVTEKKVFGSYDRGTILPRKADDDSDVDLMVVFKNPNNYLPQSFLNRLKTFAEKYYSRSEIYQSFPTIVLELNHIKFELVPAYNSYGTYYIPDGPSRWIWTDPDTTKDKVVESNRSNSYKLKPVLRLMKHWNVNKNRRSMKAYKLEEVIADELKYAYITCSTKVDYVKRAFEAIRYQTATDRVRTALDHISKALDYEKQGYNALALSEIKDVFPEV